MKLRKTGNVFAVTGSYLLSRYTGKSCHYGLPLALSIEPTNHCNLRCPECPSGSNQLTRPRGFMDFSLYQSVINQLEPFLFYLTLYFEGEPYLHPDFFRMVSYAAQKGIYTSVSTNGHFLNEANATETLKSGLHRLIVSVDGADQETYQQYRQGGKLDVVLSGIERLVRKKQELKKQRPEIILQSLLLSTTEHEVNSIKRLGKITGVDKVIFKTAQFTNYRSGNILMPENQQISRYSPGSDGEYQIKNPLRNRCFRAWSSCVITWDGQVVPCCYDKDASYPFGNLNNQTFVSIWKGKSAADFRKKIVNQRKSIDICTNCNQKY